MSFNFSVYCNYRGEWKVSFIQKRALWAKSMKGQRKKKKEKALTRGGPTLNSIRIYFHLTRGEYLTNSTTTLHNLYHYLSTINFHAYILP
jgi:hypothetical protein